jgi:hypothetical protein
VSADPDQPDFGTLLDWLEGRLDPATAARVAAQAAGADERTRRTVDWLRGFLTAARELPLYQPPPVVRQNLRQYFARWSRAQAELAQRPRDVHVRLLFDSRQDLALAGVRAGGSDDVVVHLVYTAEDGDLLVDAYPAGAGSVRLDGQVLLTEPQEAPIFEASVAGPGFTVRTVDGDELGRFTLHDVPAGPARLTASNGVITMTAHLDLDPRGDLAWRSPARLWWTTC